MKDIINNNIKIMLINLSHSKFRSNFSLTDKDIQYINDKGLDVIKRHAYDFIDKRLASAVILNDGKQTPMRGHPVFIAQHATATCCRSCLCKWHKIKTGIKLTQAEKDYIVSLIMEWINNEINNRRFS